MPILSKVYLYLTYTLSTPGGCALAVLVYAREEGLHQQSPYATDLQACNNLAYLNSAPTSVLSYSK